MTQAVLNSKSTIVICRSLFLLTTAEQTSETERTKRTLFIKFIKSKLGDSIIKPSKPLPAAYVPYSDGNIYAPPLHMIDDEPDLHHGTDVFEKPLTDQLINDELNLPLGEQMQWAKVIVAPKITMVMLSVHMMTILS